MTITTNADADADADFTLNTVYPGLNARGAYSKIDGSAFGKFVKLEIASTAYLRINVE